MLATQLCRAPLANAKMFSMIGQPRLPDHADLVADWFNVIFCVLAVNHGARVELSHH